MYYVITSQFHLGVDLGGRRGGRRSADPQLIFADQIEHFSWAVGH